MSAEAPEARPLVLLVDDDAAIRESLGGYLERSGFRVLLAADGLEAWEVLHRSRPDVLVSDVMMPGLDGRELVRRLRADRDQTPALLLTRVGESSERSAALDEGADDYLNKPFDPQELVSRVRALLRRASVNMGGGLAAEVLIAGPRVEGEVRVDRGSHRVFLDGREVSLTPRAWVLLEYLLLSPTQLHSRERLLERIWGFDLGVSTRAVDNRIAELRRVLRDDAAAPSLIHTVPGEGYRVVAKVRRG